MTGLSGLLLTSSTGAKGRWTPTARASTAVTRPISQARLSSPAAPTAISDGNRVAPPSSMSLGRKTAPRMRWPAPLSRSAPTSSGYFAKDCRLLILAATSEGEPTDTITPPTPSSRTASAMRSKSSEPAGAKSPSIQGIRSWPAFSSRVIDSRTEDAQGPRASPESGGPGVDASPGTRGGGAGKTATVGGGAAEPAGGRAGAGRSAGGGAVSPAGGVASGAGASVGADGSGTPRPDGAVPQETTIGMSAGREARPAMRRGVVQREPDVVRLFSASTG